jgi:DNA-binding transcriptional LysR family regulator
MLDGVTLDQLRTFVAAVDEGSFSAAGRKRGARNRSWADARQSRSAAGNKAVRPFRALSAAHDEGRSLLPDARAVADNIDEFKARARAMREDSSRSSRSPWT